MNYETKAFLAVFSLLQQWQVECLFDTERDLSIEQMRTAGGIVMVHVRNGETFKSRIFHQWMGDEEFDENIEIIKSVLYENKRQSDTSAAG